MVSYDVDVIIQKLVEYKKEENGKTIYPGLRDLFSYASHLGFFISVGKNDDKLSVSLCDTNNDDVQKLTKELNLKPQHHYHEGL